MSSLKDELIQLLEPTGQTHLLRYWDELTEESRQKLASQIKKIDWPQVIEWTRTAGTGLTVAELEGLKPAPYVSCHPQTHEEEAYYNHARARGIELLRAGKVAAFTVAGGQGTRLGYDGPKGTFPVTAVRHKPLFQLFAEGILRAQKEYGIRISWYIMTSIINHDATCNFFKEHAYFGLVPEQVMFFTQGMLPAFDLQTGKALLEAKDSLALSPNGHGGSVMAVLEALLRMRQACCHPALMPGGTDGQTPQTSSKVSLLMEKLTELREDGHRALVFSQWTRLLDLMEPELKKASLPFVRLDGSTRDRAEVVRRFQSPDGPPVMLVSLKAGGTGLNLTAADHVFLVDPWWNPAVEDQAADRAHRIGQERPVFIHRLVALDTVEEKILALQHENRALAEAALSGASQAGGLTREDLLRLLDD